MHGSDINMCVNDENRNINNRTRNNLVLEMAMTAHECTELQLTKFTENNKK